KANKVSTVEPTLEESYIYYDDKQLREMAEKRADQLQNEVRALIYQQSGGATITNQQRGQHEQVNKSLSVTTSQPMVEEKGANLAGQVVGSMPSTIVSSDVDETLIDSLINKPLVSGQK